MNLSSFVKQLKKRLRQKRRWLSLGFFIGAVVAILVIVGQPPETDVEGGTYRDEAVAVSGAPQRLPVAELAAKQRTLQQIDRNKQYNVLMHKTYICGDMQENLGRMSGDDVLRLYESNPQWSVQLEAEQTVILSEQIDDLSPSCKNNAYMGVDEAGNLSMFETTPDGEKVLRTFFQMNMGYLESSLPREALRQLREGIPIADVADYNSVLSTFSEFAIEESGAE